MFYRFVYGFFDAASQDDGVSARGKVFQTFAYDCLRQNNGGSGAVAGNVVRFGGNFFYKLRAHVFERIGKFDFFCDRNAVVRNQRSAELFIENNVSALGAERDFYRVGKDVYARFESFSCVVAVFNLFSHNMLLLSLFNDCYYIAVRESVLNDGENIALSDNRKLFAVYLEIGARVFRAQHFVAGFYLHFHFVSVYESAGADSHYNARLRLFLRGRGKEKAGFRLFLNRYVFHDYFVE